MAKAIKPTKEMTAHHEAGHVVALYAYGQTVAAVSIVPGEDSLGHCLHPDVYGYPFNSGREKKRIAREIIICCYAGFEAERLYSSAAREDLAAEDRSNAFSISREFEVLPRSRGYVGDDSHMKYLNRLKQTSRWVVQKNWNAVEAIANALQARKRLATTQIERVLAEFTLRRRR